MTPRELIDAFEVVAEAPDGVKRLRELVLQLAVRGKLVPQDPADEPAGVLLVRIAAEKARLVKAGKIRKTEAVPPVKADEVQFEVPVGWVWATCEQLFVSVTDGDHIPPPRADVGIPFLVIGNISGGTVNFAETRFVEPKYFDNLDWTRKPHLGDLLYTVTGSFGIVVAVESDRPFCVQRHIGILKSADETNVGFMRIALSAPIAQRFAATHATGTAQKTVSLGTLRRIPLATPPLAEQHRIVARVDELMGLLDRLEAAWKDRDATRDAARDSALAALRKADTPDEVEVAWNRIAERMPALFTRPADLEPLRQAVLQLAVRGRLVRQDPNDEPASVLLERIAAEKTGRSKSRKTDWEVVSQSPSAGSLPPGWASCKLDCVADHIVDGSHHTPTYVDEGIPFISAKDIVGGAVTFAGCRRITVDEFRHLAGRCKPKRGDVLVTKSGSIGRVAVVRTDDAFTLFESVALIPVIEPVDADYLALVVETEVAGAFGINRTKGAAVKHLHLKDLRELPVPLPPLAEQHRIVAKVDALMALIDQLEARLTAATNVHTQFAAAAVHHLDA